MKRTVVLYLATLIVLIPIDFLFLGLVAKGAMPDDRLRIELRCAIAHRRLSSFRVCAKTRIPE